jgi:hypothetical protein
MLMVTLVVTAVSFSRYSTVVEATDTVSVAKPVMDYTPIGITFNGVPMSGFESGISLSDVQPGDVLVYTFNIKNYKDADINEVLLKYLITVVFDPTPTTLPLSYSLVAGDTYPAAGGNWVYLSFGTQITHTYTLTVTWDSEDDDPAYTGQAQDIEIQIDAQQADSLV